MIPVENLAPIHFVVNRVEPSAQVRQNGQLQISVLQVNGPIGLWRSMIRKIVKHRVRVDEVTVDERECRIWVRRPQPVGRNLKGALPGSDLSLKSVGRNQNQSQYPA